MHIFYDYEAAFKLRQEFVHKIGEIVMLSLKILLGKD